MSDDMRLGGRIAIVGAGAVGLYYGSRLAANGEDVHFLLRSDFDAVGKDGIRVKSVDGDLHLKPVNACCSPEEIGEVDWIIVAWKATANGRFREVIGPMMGPRTVILTLQNGLGNDVLLGDLFGRERVLGGLCFVCINRLSPGQVEHTAGGRITVGELVPEPGNPRAQRVVGALIAAGVPSQLAESLPQAQWRKLVWNVPFNGLAIAEGGVTTDRILGELKLEDEVAALMREVIAVGRAKGHEIDESVVAFEIERTRAMDAYRPSSMIDFVERRPVEFEAIWGEPLRQAHEAGVAVPHLEALAARISAKLANR
jgi:2-dehydropantoate 2-reductase